MPLSDQSCAYVACVEIVERVACVESVETVACVESVERVACVESVERVACVESLESVRALTASDVRQMMTLPRGRAHCYHTRRRLRIATGPQIWGSAANIANKQSRTSIK
ncbi:jg5757 [Pararge aegeria aegeria]|uniref:Jg5757 protein n=1 Tax=Pararge aegeria aegeria TaxID=348720 RepID=A0A8S4SNI0_9NEOP|nr:jg5757 [Pararge aegeria aegeria]